MELMDNMRQLDVSLYGLQETLSPTLSKCRVRIFYTGLNRNHTYISEDFANQLIKSLPYTPIKGIFNKDDVDYEDHGYGREIGQIYGVVPENPNFAWERHVDADGTERVYACSDVILYTALYPEAKLIHEKGQSMEIHSDGLTGEWKAGADGEKYFEFYTGHLLGLQVLGDNVEPCFEGSAFFSLYKDAKELYDYIQKFSKKEESKDMNNDAIEKSEKIENESLEYANNETNVETVTETVEESVETNNALDVSEYTSQIEELTNKNIELENALSAAMAEIEEFKKKASRDAEQEGMRGVETNSEKSDSEDDKKKKSRDAEEEGMRGEEAETNSECGDKKKKCELDEEAQAKYAEYESTIVEKDAEIVRLNQLVSDLNSEKSELENFKKAVDTEKKTEIIKEFSASLSEEVIEEFTTKMDEFSIDDLKKELCYAAYNAGTSIINNKEESEPDLIYKNTEKNNLTGALKLLEKNKGGNR